MEKLQPTARNYSGSRNTPAPEIKAPTRRLIGIENAPMLTYRARGQQVDGAIGTGHPEMPPEHIARGLARIVRKGVRTARVREIAGVSLVLSPDIPVGTFALRTASHITAYRSETAAPIVEIPCDAPGVASA